MLQPLLTSNLAVLLTALLPQAAIAIQSIGCEFTTPVSETQMSSLIFDAHYDNYINVRVGNPFDYSTKYNASGFDPAGMTTLISALVMGMPHTDGYITLCPKQRQNTMEYVQNITTILGNHGEGPVMETVWIQVRTFDEVDCWYNVQTDGQGAIQLNIDHIANATRFVRQNFIDTGIYTGQAHWTNITNNFVGLSHFPLFWMGTGQNSSFSYDDFQSFGGWDMTSGRVRAKIFAYDGHIVDNDHVNYVYGQGYMCAVNAQACGPNTTCCGYPGYRCGGRCNAQGGPDHCERDQDCLDAQICGPGGKCCAPNAQPCGAKVSDRGGSTCCGGGCRAQKWSSLGVCCTLAQCVAPNDKMRDSYFNCTQLCITAFGQGGEVMGNCGGIGGDQCSCVAAQNSTLLCANADGLNTNFLSAASMLNCDACECSDNNNNILRCTGCCSSTGSEEVLVVLLREVE